MKLEMKVRQAVLKGLFRRDQGGFLKEQGCCWESPLVLPVIIFFTPAGYFAADAEVKGNYLNIYLISGIKIC